MYRNLLLVSTILVLYCGNAYSSTILYQVIDTLPAQDSADLMMKAKRQVSWGLTSTIAGSVLLLTAGAMAGAQAADAITDIFDPNAPESSYSSAPDILGVLGLVLLGVGIPLLIIGRRNKKKARTFAKMEKIDGLNFSNSNAYSAVGISIRIGK